MPYIETSAKDPPLNVDAAFHEVVRVIRHVQQSDEIARGVNRFADIFDLYPSTFVAPQKSSIISPTLQCYTVYSMVNLNEVIKILKYALSLRTVFKYVSFVFFVNREQPVEPQVKLRKRRFNFRQKDRQKCTLM